MTNSIKPHSSTIHLEPLGSSSLRLDPLNTSTLRLDPHSSSMLRPDTLCTSLPNLEPSSLSSSYSINSLSTSSPNLDPFNLLQGRPGASGTSRGPQSGGEALSHPKAFNSLPGFEASVEQASRPSVASPDTSPKLMETMNHQNGNSVLVPLPDPPPNSCLKTGTPTNHKDSRSNSRAGLRVHFKLPEEEDEDQSGVFEEDNAQMSVTKEPPPVRAKPKL